MTDLADRLQSDPTVYRWPAWAHLQPPRGSGSVWKVTIKPGCLRAAEVTGSISSSSLETLLDLAWRVDAFDLECARLAEVNGTRSSEEK